MEHTRAEKMQLIPKVGDSLLTNQRRAILTILEVQIYNQLCAYAHRFIQSPIHSYLVLLPGIAPCPLRNRADDYG